MPREGHDLPICRNRPFTRTFQSTCPARGTTKKAGGRVDQSRISIHVPREGHDAGHAARDLHGPISIHVPREGHDAAQYATMSINELFQSTCPARGTTSWKSLVTRAGL